MASVNKDAKGWRVLFVDSNGTRKTIRLAGIPKMNKARAEEIGRYVDDLNGAKCSNGSPDRKTSLWLAEIGQRMHDKLRNSGLIEARLPSEPAPPQKRNRLLSWEHSLLSSVTKDARRLVRNLQNLQS